MQAALFDLQAGGGLAASPRPYLRALQGEAETSTLRAELEALQEAPRKAQLQDWLSSQIAAVLGAGRGARAKRSNPTAPSPRSGSTP